VLVELGANMAQAIHSEIQAVVDNAALLSERTAFFRKTRRGHVVKVVEESYLRTDLGLGSRNGQTMTREDMALSTGLSWIVPDTNVVLHQMDFLENSGCSALDSIVILETVADEVRHNNLSVHRRLLRLLGHEGRKVIWFANEHCQDTHVRRRPGESPNDWNDRAIRVACSWFASQLSGAAEVAMLSDDRLNRAACQGGHKALSVGAFARSLEAEHPGVGDLVADFSDDAPASLQPQGQPQGQRGGQRGGSRLSGPGAAARESLYPEYLGKEQVEQRLMSGSLFKGTLRVRHGGRWDDAYVVVQSGSERVSVGVAGERVNRATEGDIVAVEILPRSEWTNPSEDKPKVPEDEEETEAGICEATSAPRPGDLESLAPGPRKRSDSKKPEEPTGRVVAVLRRNWKSLCGSILMESDESRPAKGGHASVLVSPVDKKIPRIKIQTRQLESLVGKRIIVAIDSWPCDSRYPKGHYVSTLGNIGEKSVETAVLLLEHDIPTGDFSGEVLACLPPEGWSITEENMVGRRDLRHLPVMSIDPPGCRDIDDALHWRQLPSSDNWEVGIHIADVTYYVEPGSPLDLEAANRSTSTYLVDRRLDMLPKMLTEKLCSLVGHQDRFAFSVILEVTPDGQIVDADFCKSVIHSIGAHTYGEAQEMLDDPNHPEKVKAEAVLKLNHLAKIFRRRRMEAGALTLASPEVRFVLDTETQNPLDVAMYALKETNALVEEFMLLANITVGKKILRHFPTLSLLRRHPAPNKAQFTPLVSAANAVGVDIRIGDSRELADSLDAAVRLDDEYFNKLLRIMCTRCMAPAQYFSSGEQAPEDWHHYGLATPIYTHFTSPIRR